MRSILLKIILNEMTHAPKEVPAWEAEVIHQVHPQVEKLGEGIWSHPAPDAAVEFDRLEKAYGSDKDSGLSYAAMVYGTGNLGIRRLAQSIEEESESEEESDAVATEGESVAVKNKGGRPRKVA